MLAMQNEPVHFYIEVSDADESDSLLYRWFCGGIVVGDDSEVNTSFPDTGVTRLTVVAMDGNDVDSVTWTVKISPNRAGEESEMPLKYALDNPYPNPSNAVVVIPFELPETAITD